MSEQSEKLAANIRKALGTRNNDAEAITVLVASLCQQLDQALADLSYADRIILTLLKVAEHLGIDFDIAAKEPGKPSDVFVRAIKLKQAEAVEECQIDLEHLPEYMHFTDSEMAGFKCAIQHCKGEAKRLREEATK